MVTIFFKHLKQTLSSPEDALSTKTLFLESNDPCFGGGATIDVVIVRRKLSTKAVVRIL